ncbi:MAG: sigma 54-interacting transcriptional regulator [Pseudomonadota bacterium]
MIHAPDSLPLMATRDQLLNLLVPILEPILEGVVIADRDGFVLTHNDAVVELVGHDSERGPFSLNNVGGLNLRTTLIQASLDQDDGNKSHHCEGSMQFDHQHQVNSESRWLRISTSLLSLPCENGDVRMIVFRDITAEKRLFATLGEKNSCGVISDDPDMLRLIERLNVVAGTDASLLLQGESGTGKTQLARLAHQRSKRSAKNFVEVNCGSIPATLIESELFGHVKGAFTGAVAARPGRFKAADGGTLFLDEISELPRDLQPKLLRVLQDGLYEPVGSDRTVKVDVRVLAASNRDLRDMVDQGEFRPDLYYRLAVVPLKVPPLRERPGDIPLLVDVMLERLALRGYPADTRISRETMRAVMNYPWPGNVRELANAVEHGVICAVDGVVEPESLPDALQDYCSARRRTETALPADNSDERMAIEKALRKANGNKTLAAQILGVDRSTLWRRMRRLNME